MKSSFHRHLKYALRLFVFIFALCLIQWGGNGIFFTGGGVEAKITQETKPTALDKANPHIQAAIAVQNRHTPNLMALPEVVGTAVGLTEGGRPAILVFSKARVEVEEIPASLEGMPVLVKVTGEFVSMPRPPWAGGPGGKDEANIDPTDRFDRPVPIGVSTGNEGECSAGTIGARVKGGGKVYALSNNHVYALENEASAESQVLQPGLYDTNCVYDPNDVIGTLSDFEELRFDGSANVIDAAIALSSTGQLGNATPSDGYGKPSSSIASEALGQPVMKYGRTTSLTKGEITGIHAAVYVGYSSGTAIFEDQIIVSSYKGPFIKAGDSGSLLVTDPGAKPVGLLFAGNGSGKTAVANPIGKVLNRFHVTIDSE